MYFHHFLFINLCVKPFAICVYVQRFCGTIGFIFLFYGGDENNPLPRRFNSAPILPQCEKCSIVHCNSVWMFLLIHPFAWFFDGNMCESLLHLPTDEQIIANIFCISSFLYYCAVISFCFYAPHVLYYICFNKQRGPVKLCDKLSRPLSTVYSSFFS